MFLWIVNFVCVGGGGDFLKEDKIIRNLKWIPNYFKKNQIGSVMERLHCISQEEFKWIDEQSSD